MAARVLQRTLLGGARLDQQLDQLPDFADPRDRGLVHELATGIVRWYPRLDRIVAQMLHRPLKDPDLNIPILLGIYQLIHTRVPTHAAISTSVDTAAALGFKSAKGLVNGVLRRFVREREDIEKAIAKDPVAQFAHPQWLIYALRDAWQEAAPQVLARANEIAPLTLRCNLQKTSRDAYLVSLHEAGVAAEPHPVSEVGINIVKGGDPRQLPGFETGHFSVQDGAAQLAAKLLDAPAGARVLDACAAPGGKSAAILERAPDIQLTALDVDAERLQLVEQTLSRVGLTANVRVGDAMHPATWADGNTYSHMLVDAPCTATGIIRRHPDIKLRRAAGDDAKLAVTQLALLKALWPLLESGGTLLYATCSIMPTENSNVVSAFLSAHADAEIVPLSLPCGRDTGGGTQLLPGDEDMDGFFYAKVCKR